MGISWSGGGDFSNAAGATSTVITIPSGSYGPTPMVGVAVGVRGGDTTSPLTTHTVFLRFPDTSTTNLVGVGGCAVSNRIGRGFFTEFGVPTGDLDGGADIRI
ncbi:MAG: hypothetical protein EHM35_14780, partial [Planctomycetaceae bacterium]